MPRLGSVQRVCVRLTLPNGTQYVEDLRELQAEIHALLSDLQGYTANPRTDASLGKVGR